MIKLGVKDGGPESPVTFYGIEVKCLFSIGFLVFKAGRREAYHDHAFNALTWFLWGRLTEERLVATKGGRCRVKSRKYKLTPIPKYTARDNLHRVRADRKSVCLTLRGPWVRVWKEYNPATNKFTVLTKGRKVIGTYETS